MAKTYARTDLSQAGSLVLEISGIEYQVVQYTGTFGVNEIPRANCMVAVGRNIKENLIEASINRHGTSLLQMQEASVYFLPEGEYEPFIPWPEQRVKIFDGLVSGVSFAKINGKIHASVNLVHWLAKLAFSSCLTANGSVSNPAELNTASIFGALDSTGLAAYTSVDAAYTLISSAVAEDLWKGVKSLFCALASKEVVPVVRRGECGGDGDYTVNTAALDALNRIEGPAPECSTPYVWSQALKMDIENIAIIPAIVADAINSELLATYANTTFWDKLVGTFAPMFGLAIVPRVDTAFVIADVPTYTSGYWRNLLTADYDSFQLDAVLERPLRAVGVISGFDGASGAASGPLQEPVRAGGCFTVNSLDDPGKDGIVQFVYPPPWLLNRNLAADYASVNHNYKDEKPAKAVGADAEAGTNDNDPETFGNSIVNLYNRYAAMRYYNDALRGRSGQMSGKLRFDIAPGSIVRIAGSGEKFIGGEDDLAVTLYGYVSRVTTSINAESQHASTSFQLNYLRTENEYERARESASDHWLFPGAVHGQGKHGAPLIDEYEFPEAEGQGEGPPPPAQPAVPPAASATVAAAEAAIDALVADITAAI